MGILLVNQTPEGREKRARNIAFEGISGCLDTVTVFQNGRAEEVEIPALHRTNYWAILRYMYQNHSRRVYLPEFVRGVAAIMEDADITKWERFKRKGRVKTCVKSADDFEVVEQTAKSWVNRLVTNGRNLARVGKGNAYGKRLLARGHVLRFATDDEGHGYFILHLRLTAENTAPAKRGRKPLKLQEDDNNQPITLKLPKEAAHGILAAA